MSLDRLTFRPIEPRDQVRGNRAPIRDDRGAIHAAEWSGQAWVYSACPNHEIDGRAIEIGTFSNQPQQGDIHG